MGKKVIKTCPQETPVGQTSAFSAWEGGSLRRCCSPHVLCCEIQPILESTAKCCFTQRWAFRQEEKNPRPSPSHQFIRFTLSPATSPPCSGALRRAGRLLWQLEKKDERGTGSGIRSSQQKQGGKHYITQHMKTLYNRLKGLELF